MSPSHDPPWPRASRTLSDGTGNRPVGTIRRGALLGVLLTVRTLMGADPADRPTPSASTPVLATPDGRLRRAFDSGGISGGIHLVVRDGRVIHRSAVGTGDPATGRPFGTDSLVRIYSMSKPITSVGALLLHERGAFDLDDPVARFIPAFGHATVLERDGDRAVRVPPSRQITVRDVFTHRTGYSYGDEPEVRKHYEREGLRYHGPHELFPPEMTLERAADALARVPALHHPGERFTYGFNTDLLGRLIEVWSGSPLDVFLRENVFDPLAMADTGFVVPAAGRDRFTACMALQEGRPVVVDPAATSPFLNGFLFLSGGGGLVSTANDYARFGEMLAGGGMFRGRRLLREATVRLMFTDQLGAGEDGFRFGLGLELRTVTLGAGAGGRKATELTWGGYASTDFRIIPSERLVQIFLRQTVPFDNRLALQLAADVYTHHPPHSPALPREGNAPAD